MYYSKGLKALDAVPVWTIFFVFSLAMWAIGWANVADSDLIFRGISFRYWWEPAKQDNITRVYLHLSTKLSQKRLEMIKNSIPLVIVGGFRWF